MHRAFIVGIFFFVVSSWQFLAVGSSSSSEEEEDRAKLQVRIPNANFAKLSLLLLHGGCIHYSADNVIHRVWL